MFPNLLHIITVHIPVILTPVLAVWMFPNLKNQSDRTWKWIYAASILLAIVASISYFTGPATADHIKSVIQNYPQDLVENHALWGRITFILQVFSGLIGIMALSGYLQGEKPSQKLPYILFVLLLINTLILLYTAHLGGMIRRPDLY